jgi:hypothetical protein
MVIFCLWNDAMRQLFLAFACRFFYFNQNQAAVEIVRERR